MIKETRFYDKLEAVRRAGARDAVLVHVVRDPRAVAASMMMGKRPQAGRLRDPRRLLRRAREAQALVEPGSSRRSCSSAPSTRTSAGRRTSSGSCSSGSTPSRAPGARAGCLFGDRYVLLRNEELRADPVAAIARVYEAAGAADPGAVAEWARGKVRAPEVPFAATDPRWGEAFAALGMREALERRRLPRARRDAARRAGPPASGRRCAALLGRAAGLVMAIPPHRLASAPCSPAS